MDNGASSYRRFLEGDESAFEEIYNDTKRGLFAFIMSICRHYQTAEDMMQPHT